VFENEFAKQKNQRPVQAQQRNFDSPFVTFCHQIRAGFTQLLTSAIGVTTFLAGFWMRTYRDV
jgi:hypothetical protein